MAHYELKWIKDKAWVFLKKLSVHLFQQKEVFADFLSKVSESEIQI